jgi:hypothetical protein
VKTQEDGRGEPLPQLCGGSFEDLYLQGGFAAHGAVEGSKTAGTMEERLQVLEDTVFRYGTMVERRLDAHHLMNIEIEKKVEAYEARIKDIEETYVHIITHLDRFQALMWDVENQN